MPRSPVTSTGRSAVAPRPGTVDPPGATDPAWPPAEAEWALLQSASLRPRSADVQVALGEYRFLADAALRAQDFPLAESLIMEFLAVQPNAAPLLELAGEFGDGKATVLANEAKNLTVAGSGAAHDGPGGT